MEKLLHWIRNGDRRSAEELHLGDLDPYVVQLVRRSAVLRAQAEQQ